MATFMLKESTSSQKMATSMLKVASDIYKMPTPLRTSQTSGHSSFRVSNLPLWSLKSPPSHGSKIIIFYLSQSKCTVSAHFCTPAGKPCFSLHCLHSVHRGGTCRGKAPPSCCARPLRRLKAPLGLSLLRCACKREFSYLPRDTPFKKGRRTKHCAAALKFERVLL